MPLNEVSPLVGISVEALTKLETITGCTLRDMRGLGVNGLNNKSEEIEQGNIHNIKHLNTFLFLSITSI